MRKRILWTSLCVALAWFGYRAYRAYTNRVTLDVRDMEVRQVVSKLEWQTWERILVHKAVSGRVTLNVQNAPLSEVLGIIGLQVSARWTTLYPLYATRRSVDTFQKAILGELPPPVTGWLNLQKAPIWQRGGGTAFGNTARAENNLVSAQIVNKDLDFTALALSRFSKAQVIPEDSAKANITLKLEQVPFNKAVAQVAKQARRKWDLLYTLQPLNAQIAKVKGPDGKVSTPPTPSPAPRVEEPQSKERETEAFLATMTPDERQKAQEQIAAMQQMESLSPAERQQGIQAMAAQAAQASQADLEQRIQERLKNGTVQQRVDRDRRKLQKSDPTPRPQSH